MPDRPRVAVLYNNPTLPIDHPEAASERSVLATSAAIVAALRPRGFRAFRVGVGPPVGRLVRRLLARKADAAVNLVEGFGGEAAGEPRFAALLELLAIPFTGCPPATLALCRRKGTARHLLAGAGLPIAPGWTIDRDGPIPPPLTGGPGWPGAVVVKPEGEDGSLGIDQSSVVTDPAELPARVAHLFGRFPGPVLVEAYLPGPEYNLGLLEVDPDGPVPLRPAEVAFEVSDGRWPILTYAAKWSTGSADDRASPVRCPADLPGPLAAELDRLAVAAFRVTGCRDVARVDFRLDAAGRPMILEVNPNPDLDPAAGWARALRAAGRDYGETVAALVRRALDRGGAGRRADR